MELTFEKVGNQYVAEFQAPSDFNLHIEREEIGVLEVHQRGSEEGKYDFAWSTGVSGRKVVDYDFGALVYPKWIKVVSGSEVVNASVNFNEGGGSGNGSGEDTNKIEYSYYKIKNYETNFLPYSFKYSKLIKINELRILSPAAFILDYMYSYDDNVTSVIAIAVTNEPLIDFNSSKDNGANTGSWKNNLLQMNSFFSEYDFDKVYEPITEEEFYNLEE